MTSDRFAEIEHVIANAHDNSLGIAAKELLKEYFKLKHELEHPMYLYNNGRIARQALISRDGQISKLKQEIKRLKGENAF